MKTLRILLLIGAMLWAAGSAKADGSDVLERMVHLSKTKDTVYSLLGELSKQSGCLFIYDSKVIDNDAKVKVRTRHCTLRQAIYEITGNNHLQLKVLGNHILLLPPMEKVPVRAPAASLHPLLYTTLTGVLLDKETGAPVVNASVMVQGTSMGNITNLNGEFRLILPDSLRHHTLCFSHLGYVKQCVEAIALEGRTNVVSLEPRVIPLQEVLIRLVEPQKLIRDMMAHRRLNYATSPVYLTTFYREGVQLKDKFQSLTEAVFQVYKAPVSNPHAADQVKLLKMSRIDNREKSDSLIAKIHSGVKACLELDLMKNMPDFLSTESGLNVYSSGDIVFLDDRSAHVVRFKQKPGTTGPLFSGELFIDSENNALLQARFEVQPQYTKQATSLFVMRQAPNTRLTVQKIAYTVSYKPWKGTYYIHHIRGDLYFKMKRKRMLFANPTLYTWFEMVTCGINQDHVTHFSRTERLPMHTVFAETAFKYDASFWADFNVIPLEEKLSRIIEKVALKIEQTDGL